MKLSIEINADNIECSSITNLLEILYHLCRYTIGSPTVRSNVNRFSKDDGKILDANGGSVGKWSIEK